MSSFAGVLDTQTGPAYTNSWYTDLYEWSALSVVAFGRLRWMDVADIVATTSRFWHLWVSGVYWAKNQSRFSSQCCRWVCG